MKKIVLICFLGTIMLILQGTEVMAGGSASYPNGSEAFLVAVAPPPGFYFLNYAYYYDADNLKDDGHHNIDVFDDLDVISDVLRFIWFSDKKILGATYGQQFFIPYVSVDLDFKDRVGPKQKKHYSDNGLPYLIYSPLILSYQFCREKFHTVFSLVDIYIPTGQDDKNLAAVGHNFWTFEPVAAFTYLYDNWEFSVKLMYDWSTKQDDCPTVYGFEVDRDPGQEFHGDYSISYGFGKSMRLGLSGYYYIQTTDDDYHLGNHIPDPVQDLLKDDETNRSEVFAVGPGMWYNYKNMFFSLRTQWEMGAKNKSQGQNVWFKFTYAF